MCNMRNKSADTVKGEAAMTDFQFKAYIELRDKYDAAVRELELMRQKNEIQMQANAEKQAEIQAKSAQADEGTMSDYQFQRYEKLRDKCEELTHENTLLREENAKLKVQAEMLKSLSEGKNKK